MSRVTDPCDHGRPAGGDRWLRGVVLVVVLSAAPVLANQGHPDPAESLTTDDRLATTHDVVVVGAGIAGLSAAVYLSDYDVVVLEKEPRVGGRAESGTRGPFSYAMGTEYLGQPEGALAGLLRELELDPVEIPSPQDAYWRGGAFYYGEDGLALMLVNHSSLEEFNGFVATIQEYAEGYNDVPDLDLGSDLAQLDSMTALAWFQMEGFASIFQEIYNTGARGLFGASMDEISALSFIPEIAFDYEDAEPVGSIDDLENDPTPGLYSTGSYTFVKGIAEVTDAAASHLGDRVMLNATAVEVRCSHEWVQVLYEDASHRLRSLFSRVVILTVPAPVALDIGGEELDEERRGLLSSISYSAYATVSLFSSAPIFDRAFDLSVPGDWFFTDVYDSTWVQRWYEESLADEDTYVVGVYVAPPSYQDRSLLAMTDQQLADLVLQDLERVFPDVRSRVEANAIRRFPHAYPVMTPGAYARLTRLNELNNGALLLAGDFMVYPTYEAAAESGNLAARRAVDVLEGPVVGPAVRTPTGRVGPAP